MKIIIAEIGRENNNNGNRKEGKLNAKVNRREEMIERNRLTR